jgi:hypothetical protein
MTEKWLIPEGPPQKIGTCRHCFQVQDVWEGLVDAGAAFSMKPVVDAELYACQWLDQFGPLPPAIDRMNGSFILHGHECDVCPHYAPVQIAIPGVKS